MGTKVFIINKSSHDFSGAEHFGEPVFMTNKPINRFATNQIVRRFTPFIEQSNKNDYLLLTGLSIMSTIAGAMFALKHGRLNLLIYRGQTEKEKAEWSKITDYVSRTIVFKTEKEQENES